MPCGESSADDTKQHSLERHANQHSEGKFYTVGLRLGPSLAGESLPGGAFGGQARDCSSVAEESLLALLHSSFLEKVQDDTRNRYTHEARRSFEPTMKIITNTNC